jgi:hypothetical protein
MHKLIDGSLRAKKSKNEKFGFGLAIAGFFIL